MKSTAQWSPTVAELSRALEHEEFVVHYQPIVELQNNRLAGVEALIRWQHPERGLLRPGAFVGVADGSGFGVQMTEWTQRAACRQLLAWSNAELHPPLLSMNISPAQAKPDCLGPHLRSLLSETGIDPQRIAIEIHEDFLPDPTTAHIVLAELASVGIPLWLDDFGTGPSALPYLAQYPFSVLKIDREYVLTMMDDPRKTRLVSGLIDFAHHLDLQVIAEGVISSAHLEFLREHGCDMGQGGYLGLPAPAETITTLLQSGGIVVPVTGYVD